MERLVVFLDNEIYGGSERLMYTVLTSKLIRENYIVNALMDIINRCMTV